MPHHAREAAVADYLAGDTAAVVADRYGVHPRTVLVWVKAAGHEPRGHRDRHPHHPDRAAAVADYLAGESLLTVGTRYGVTESLVRRWVLAAGHTTRARGHPPQRHPDRDAAVAACKAGEPPASVAARLGLHPTTVYQWVAADRAPR